MGWPWRSEVVATRALLFVADSNRFPSEQNFGGGRSVRALDKATGRQVWEAQLEAGSTAAPMTYMHQGRQYVVFVIRSVNHPAEMVALRLP